MSKNVSLIIGLVSLLVVSQVFAGGWLLIQPPDCNPNCQTFEFDRRINAFDKARSTPLKNDPTCGYGCAGVTHNYDQLVSFYDNGTMGLKGVAALYFVVAPVSPKKIPYNTYEVVDTFETLKACQDKKAIVIADADRFIQDQISAMKNSPKWGSWFLADGLNSRFYALESICMPSDSQLLKK